MRSAIKKTLPFKLLINIYFFIAHIIRVLIIDLFLPKVPQLYIYTYLRCKENICIGNETYLKMKRIRLHSYFLS